jgi:glycosyltransferase involved in cell wall biosynthesis
MRVLILTADFPPQAWSGIGIAVRRQAAALAALGITVHVVIGKQPPPYSVQSSVRNPANFYLIGKYFPVDASRYDLVHLHSLSLGEMALELKRRFHLPLIYTMHSLIPVEIGPAAPPGFWSTVQGRILGQSDRIICLSESERAALCRLLPEAVSCTHVIPNGVFPLRDSRHPYNLHGPVVYAGRFARSKGLRILADMIEAMHSRSGNRVKFIFAGGHGDREITDALFTIAKRYPSLCEVRDWMEPEKLEALLKTASVAVIPSRYEPFGLVAVESMRLGVPVLVSDAGGLTETVRPESGGVVEGSREPEKWAETLLGLLNNSALRNKLSERGPQYVAANYDINRISKRMIDEVYAA